MEMGEISGSRDGEYEHDCLQGDDRLDDGGSMHRETSINFYQTTRRNIPEDRHAANFQFVKYFI
jgi:hypothetical protein